MSSWKLYLTMYSTLAIIIGISTFAFILLLKVLGVVTPLWFLVLLVVAFNVGQWLLAPYIIEAIYNVREADPTIYSWLHEIVERLAKKSGISKPKVMIASVPIPNAFAYGSPLTGYKIAVTEGLLRTLNRSEIEAVIGHEIGHIVHKDVVIMMIVSLLPAILYYIGYSLMYYGGYSYGSDYYEEDKSAYLPLIGFLVLIISFVLYLFTLALSRYREYYADRHSATIVKQGARKLQLALAKIVTNTAHLTLSNRVNISKFHCFKALFITDPDKAIEDYVQLRGEYTIVERLKARKLTFADYLVELLSTHPNIVKRLKALDEIAKELGQA